MKASNVQRSGKPRVLFISHSSKDKRFARRLASDLYELGHKPWLDHEEISVGDDIFSKVEQGITRSDFVIVILSNNSVKSGWVEKEWKSKYWDEIQERKVKVLPIVIEDCPIPTLLRTKKYANFKNSYAVGFAELTEAVGRVRREPNAAHCKVGAEVGDSVDPDADYATYEHVARELAKSGNINQSLRLSNQLMKHYEQEEALDKATEWALHIAIQYRHQGKLLESLQSYAVAENLCLNAKRKEPASFESSLAMWQIRAGRIMVEDYLLSDNFREAFAGYGKLIREMQDYQSYNVLNDSETRRLELYQVHAIRQQAEMQRLIGRYSEALNLFAKAYRGYHAIYLEERCYSLLGQAECLRMLGDDIRSTKKYNELEWIAREKGYWRLLARVLRSKAELARTQGLLTHQLLDELRDLSEEEDAQYLFGKLYYLLIAAGSFLSSDLKQADSLFNEVKSLATHRVRAEYAHALFGLAEVKRLRRKTSAARRLYSQANSLYARMGMQWGIVRTNIGLALNAHTLRFEKTKSLEGIDRILWRKFLTKKLGRHPLLFQNMP